MNREDIKQLREEVSDEFVVKDDYIDVGDNHKVWYQLWGNVEAKVPFIFFHGGPGGQVSQKHKKSFDPTKQLVIFFDQRGCGRSTYQELLKGNTTQKLIEDAKLIVDKLGYEEVKPFGGSWGSTLAMIFTITYPTICEKVIIRGVFPADKKSLQHWDDGSMELIYPEVWQKLLGSTPKEFHHAPTRYHFKIIGEAGDQADRSCAVMQNYEGNIMKLDDDFEFIDVDNLPDDFDPTGYTIFAHFENNDYFLEDGYIIDNLSKYRGEVAIVHGRFDMVTPYRDALRVKQAAHNAQLYSVIASHLTNHEAIAVLQSLINNLGQKSMHV